MHLRLFFALDLHLNKTKQGKSSCKTKLSKKLSAAMKLDGTDTRFIYTARKMIGEGRIVGREIGEPLEPGRNLACQIFFSWCGATTWGLSIPEG